MKFLLYIILLIAATAVRAQDLFAGMRPGERGCVVAVHHECNDAQMAVQTISRLNTSLAAQYPNCDFREAYVPGSTPIAVYHHSPASILEELRADGYTRILIVPSLVCENTPMTTLRRTVSSMASSFRHIRLAAPLLSSVDDYSSAALNVLTKHGKEKSINVLVLKGKENDMTLQSPPLPSGEAMTECAMLEYVLRDKGINGCTAASLNTYPQLSNLISMLRTQKNKKVNLIPFDFAPESSISATLNSIWIPELKKNGYKATLTNTALGTIDKIIELYLRHAKEAE